MWRLPRSTSTRSPQRPALLVRDVERTTNDFDQGKFGYKEKFLSLKEEIEKKVPQ